MKESPKVLEQQRRGITREQGTFVNSARWRPHHGSKGKRAPEIPEILTKPPAQQQVGFLPQWLELSPWLEQAFRIRPEGTGRAGDAHTHMLSTHSAHTGTHTCVCTHRHTHAPVSAPTRSSAQTRTEDANFFPSSVYKAVTRGELGVHRCAWAERCKTRPDSASSDLPRVRKGPTSEASPSQDGCLGLTKTQAKL